MCSLSITDSTFCSGVKERFPRKTSLSRQKRTIALANRSRYQMRTVQGPETAKRNMIGEPPEASSFARRASSPSCASVVTSDQWSKSQTWAETHGASSASA